MQVLHFKFEKVVQLVLTKIGVSLFKAFEAFNANNTDFS